MKKKVDHAGKILFQAWLSEEEMLKAKLLSKQYGITLSGLVRLIINQPYGTVYVKSLDLYRKEKDNETGIEKGNEGRAGSLFERSQEL
jgi:hypothetical protein